MKLIEGTTRGYFPVYWELFDDYNLGKDEIFFFHYLSETFPTWYEQKEIDGVIYKRLADTLVQEKIRDIRANSLVAVSSNTIRKWFDTLEENGYIKTWSPYKNGPRYYTITLEIVNPLDSGYYKDKSSCNSSNNTSSNSSCKKGATKDTIETIETTDTIDIIKHNTKSDDLAASNDASKISSDITESNDLVKQVYGLYNNILLTIEEYNLIKKLYPTTYTDLINSVSTGIKEKGYNYKSHFDAIKNWKVYPSKKTTTKKVVNHKISPSQRRDVNDYARNEDGTPMVFNL